MKENSIKNEQSSIEEAIETMKHWIEYEKANKKKINKADELISIQETILSDYKRVLQENEYMHNELDKQQTKINKYAKENEELKKFHIQDNKHLDFIMQHSIPVQKVKDKIEKEIKYHEKNILDIENITMLKGKTAKEEAEIEFNKYAIVVLKKMLQELLEGRK